MSEAEQAIIRAIMVPGRRPDIHQEQIRRLSQEWPSLAGALAALLHQDGKPIPREWRSMPHGRHADV